VHLPERPLELLQRLVAHMRLLVDELRDKCIEERQQQQQQLQQQLQPAPSSAANALPLSGRPSDAASTAPATQQLLPPSGPRGLVPSASSISVAAAAAASGQPLPPAFAGSGGGGGGGGPLGLAGAASAQLSHLAGAPSAAAAAFVATGGAAHGAYSSLSQAPEEMVLDPSRPCSGERPLLMFDRWRKLLKSFWSDKKATFDISKIPDIYDSAKYDAIHNGHLGLKALAPLYADARCAANAVIPNEYGLAPAQRLDIGGKIAAELLGKLLADLESMREESLATAAVAARAGRRRAARLRARRRRQRQRRRQQQAGEGAVDWEDEDEDDDDMEEEEEGVYGAEDDEEDDDGWDEDEDEDDEEGEEEDGAENTEEGGADALDSDFGRTSVLDSRLYSAGGAAKVAEAFRKLQLQSPGAGRLERLPEAPPAASAGADESGGSKKDDEASGGGGGAGGASGAGGGGGNGGGSGGRTPERETLHRLCPTYAADVNSPLRHVRTRVYFTSESHMHSLINVLRYCHLGAAGGGAGGTGGGGAGGGGAAAATTTTTAGAADPAAAAAAAASAILPPKSPTSPQPSSPSNPPPEQPLLSPSGLAQLDSTPELDYLTHVVLRMFEDKAAPLESPDRFFVEVLFSAGANHDPTAFFSASNSGGSGATLHVLPPKARVALHPGRGVALDRAGALLSRYAAARHPCPPVYPFVGGGKGAGGASSAPGAAGDKA
jgi:hypothetical protein